MTYWFASKVDEKRVQMWGGWISLVQMLDTYRGVIDSLEHLNLEGIDQFALMNERPEVAPPSLKESLIASPTVELEMGNVVSLDDYRRRRLA
jgi:hypothetical protein